MKLNIEGFDQERVERMLIEHLAGRADEILTSTLKAHIEHAVAKVAADVVESRVREAVEAVIAEGWQRTNSYGEASGKRTTLRERVAEWMTEKDGYGSDKRRIDKLFTETITTYLGKEMKAELDAVRKQFRAEADALLKAKLVDSLRDALGLR